MSILLKYHSELRGGPNHSISSSKATSGSHSNSSVNASAPSSSGAAAAVAETIVAPLAELDINRADAGKSDAAQSSSETAADSGSDEAEEDEEDDADEEDEDEDEDEDQLLRLSSLQGQSKTASASVRQQAARKLDSGAARADFRSTDAFKSTQIAAAPGATVAASSSSTKARSWWEYEQGVEDSASVAKTADGVDEDDNELAGDSETVENELNRLVVGTIKI